MVRGEAGVQGGGGGGGIGKTRIRSARTNILSAISLVEVEVLRGIWGRGLVESRLFYTPLRWTCSVNNVS